MRVFPAILLALAAVAATCVHAEDSKPPAGPIVHGSVIEAISGAPLPGARVSAFELPPNAERQELAWNSADGPSAPAASALAGADGGFRIALPDGDETRLVLLEADAPGKAAVSCIVEVPAHASEEFAADFALLPGVPFALRIVDAQGAAVPGARAALLPSSPEIHAAEEFPCRWPPIFLPDPAGPDGVAHAVGVAPGPYRLIVNSGGRGGGECAASLLGNEEIAVRLWPPRCAEGTILSKKDRREFPGAWVFAINEARPLGHARSDAHGRFRMPDLPPGDVSILFQAAGYYVDALLWAESEPCPAEHLAERIDEPLAGRDPYGPIRGRVFTDRGRPAVGAELFAVFGDSHDGVRLDSERPDVLRLHTGLGADFRACGDSRERFVMVVATHPVWGSAHTTPIPVADLSRMPPLDLKLVGARVSGTLRDAKGKPVANAEVCAEEVCLLWYERTVPVALAAIDPRTWTDREGRFVLLGVPPGPTALHVLREGRDEGVVRWFAMAPGLPRDALDLRLPPDGTLRGRVVDATGNGVLAEVAAESATDEEWSAQTQTAADGSFAITAIPARIRGLHLRASAEDTSAVLRYVPVSGTAVEVRLPR